MALAIRSKLLLTLIPVLFLALAPLPSNADDFTTQAAPVTLAGGPNAALPAGQQALADAQASGQGVNFIEVTDVTVVRTLPDDTQGLQHQKWVVALDNGSQVLVVYNIDICDRVPVQIGQKQSIGGQYIWDRGGGLLHWVHADPRQKRPDGYVDVDGVRYGAVTHPNR